MESMSSSVKSRSSLLIKSSTFKATDLQGILTKIPTCEKQNKQRKHTSKKTITCTRQYLRGSAICLLHEVAGISLLSEKIQQCTRILSRNPNPNYTLALSHRKNKNRSQLPLFFLFSLIRLLTRLIGISLKSILCIQPHIIKHIHKYILLYKVG